MKDYIFGPAEKKDIEDIFALYAERVRWMDAHGISQWNVTRYLAHYPLSYYREQCEQGNLYSLRCAGDDLPVGAVVLRQSDERWPDKAGVPAYYIHNLVTRPGIKGREHVSSQKRRGLPLNMANVSFVWIAPSIMRL